LKSILGKCAGSDVSQWVGGGGRTGASEPRLKTFLGGKNRTLRDRGISDVGMSEGGGGGWGGVVWWCGGGGGGVLGGGCGVGGGGVGCWMERGNGRKGGLDNKKTGEATDFLGGNSTWTVSQVRITRGPSKTTRAPWRGLLEKKNCNWGEINLFVG